MSRDHYSTQGPICPYCLHQATADEPGYYDESATTDECGSCGKTYSMSVYISTSWTTEALPDDAGQSGQGVGDRLQTGGVGL